MKRSKPDSPTNSPNKKPLYYTYRTDIIECKECRWRGPGVDAKRGDMIDYSFFLDCPKCDNEFILCIPFPTFDEVKLYGSDKEKKEAIENEKIWDKYDKEKLKNADQINNIDAKEIVLYWDITKNDKYQLIIHENKTIWDEPATYESFERFVEIGKILKEKFGSRLKDLIPTKRSEIYLYGDKYRSIEVVKKFRESLKS